MNYFRLTDDIQFPKRWYLGDVKDVDNWALSTARQGVELPDAVEIEVYQQGKPMDFTLTEAYVVPVVSRKLREALGDLPGARFIEATVDGAAKGDHFVMFVESTVECVDESRSEFEKFTADDPVRPDKAGQFRAFFELLVDPVRARASGLSVFRLARFTAAIIVDERVKKIFESVGATGAVMTAV